jgi:hypothetical protein
MAMKISHRFVLLLTICTIFAFQRDVWAGVESKPSFVFRTERTAGKTDRVEIRLEVGGDTKFAKEGKPQREKMSVLCELDYVEKTLAVPEDAKDAWRSVRDYQKVTADVKVGEGQFKPTLAPEHRRIVVEAAGQTVTLFSPDGNLTRDELDAIDIQANSLLLDLLLPEKSVTIGDHWQHSAELLGAFLRLDEVAKTTVESTLKEVTGTVARFEIAGRVEGAIDGVSTVIEMKGRYRFDLRTKRIDWLGMLIQENRENSFVSDGVDVVSRLAIKITPVKEPTNLSDEALAKLTLKPSPESVCLAYESAVGDWRCALDRRWYLYHQRPKIDTAVLRFVDRGEFTGQCNLSSLPQRKPDELISLEKYQEDIQKALGKGFGEFVEASQTSNDANYRIYRVAANGTSSEIPMQWIYYLVADSQGRQVAFTFAVEQKLIERFAGADRALVESMRFAK